MGDSGGFMPALVLAVTSAHAAIKKQHGYRYHSDIFEDRQQQSTLKILKTIKCKPNSSSDWYAERVVFVHQDKRFERFQDSMLARLKEYFETPNAAGPLQSREHMMRLRQLDDSDKDYFSAFYTLDQYMDEFVYSQSTMNGTHHLRINTVVAF